MTDDAEKNEAKARGGFARAEALTAEERAESARKAALARWAKPAEESTVEEITPADDDVIAPEPAMPIARWRVH